MIVLGIDPSLTGLGLCSGPADFDFRWRRVSAVCLGKELRKGAGTAEKLRRVSALAADVCRYAVRERVDRVWIEGQLAKGQAFNVPPLCELIGVIRDRLLNECGLVAELAPQTSVRKLLLGYLPQKDRKAHVIEALKAQNIVLSDGLPPRDGDAYDAIATWNYGLHELFAPCLTGLLGEKPKPAPKPRKTRAKKGQTAGYLDVIAGGAG